MSETKKDISTDEKAILLYFERPFKSAEKNSCQFMKKNQNNA